MAVWQDESKINFSKSVLLLFLPKLRRLLFPAKKKQRIDTLAKNLSFCSFCGHYFGHSEPLLFGVYIIYVSCSNLMFFRGYIHFWKFFFDWKKWNWCPFIKSPVFLSGSSLGSPGQLLWFLLAGSNCFYNSDLPSTPAKWRLALLTLLIPLEKHPWRIHGTIVYLPTWMAQIYGKCREIYQSHGSYGTWICVLFSCSLVGEG